MKTFITIGIVMWMILFSITANATWYYGKSVDTMTSNTVVHASTISKNSLELDFPYAGFNPGTLRIYNQRRSGTRVLLSVSKGQILCSHYDCRIQIRFDDNAPIMFSGSGSADHDSTVVFINNTDKFINMARKSSKILIQITLYHNGNQILEFTTLPSLAWEIK